VFPLTFKETRSLAFFLDPDMIDRKEELFE
jgi:hypothetical protein